MNVKDNPRSVLSVERLENSTDIESIIILSTRMRAIVLTLNPMNALYQAGLWTTALLASLSSSILVLDHGLEADPILPS